MSIDVPALRKALRAEAADLRETLQDARQQLLESPDDEMLQAGVKLQESQLRRVEHALTRHEDGTWQTCEACGGKITDEQVRVLATATHCEDCAGDQVFWGDTHVFDKSDLDPA